MSKLLPLSSPPPSTAILPFSYMFLPPLFFSFYYFQSFIFGNLVVWVGSLISFFTLSPYKTISSCLHLYRTLSSPFAYLPASRDLTLNLFIYINYIHSSRLPPLHVSCSLDFEYTFLFRLCFFLFFLFSFPYHGWEVGRY